MPHELTLDVLARLEELEKKATSDDYIRTDGYRFYNHSEKTGVSSFGEFKHDDRVPNDWGDMVVALWNNRKALIAAAKERDRLRGVVEAARVIRMNHQHKSAVTVDLDPLFDALAALEGA